MEIITFFIILIGVTLCAMCDVHLGIKDPVFFCFAGIIIGYLAKLSKK